MDYQVLFNIAATLTAFFGGWVLRHITDNLKQLAYDLRTLDEKHQRTREDYVAKVDHAAEMAKFEHRFDRLDDKLDAIAHGITTKTA